MTTGELPSAGNSLHRILYKHISEEAPRAAAGGADVPEPLSAAVWRAMSKDPDHRYATMEEFASAVWPEQPVAPPHQGRPVVRQRHRVMADAPTEITGAPTTPLPATRAKTPPKRSRAGLVIRRVIVAARAGGGP